MKFRLYHLFTKIGQKRNIVECPICNVIYTFCGTEISTIPGSATVLTNPAPPKYEEIAERGIDVHVHVDNGGKGIIANENANDEKQCTYSQKE